MNFKVIKGAIVLLCISVASAFVYNHLSPNGIALFGQWNTQKGVVKAISKSDQANPSMEILDPAIVHAIVLEKKRLVIDARQGDFYDMGHLPGAVSYPLVEYDQYIRQFTRIIDRAQPLLIYCSSPECEDSHNLAKRLIDLKYVDVKVFSGGFQVWEEEGYRVETDED